MGRKQEKFTSCSDHSVIEILAVLEGGKSLNFSRTFSRA